VEIVANDWADLSNLFLENQAADAGNTDGASHHNVRRLEFSQSEGSCKFRRLT